MLDSSERGRFLEWILILLFFLAAPYFVLALASEFATMLSTPGSDRPLNEFIADRPWLLLTFYSGVVGGVVSYVAERTQAQSESDQPVTRIAKLLAAGLMGVAAYMFVRSGFLVKLFYPGLKWEGGSELDHRSLLGLAILAGLVGPRLVGGVRKKVEEKLGG
jgi:hypothetical protein